MDLGVMDYLAGCRVLEQIGSGGMGSVYKVDRNGEILAAKTLDDRFNEDEFLTRRFVDEGKMMSQLSHPNIVKVLDVGQDMGHYYILMEYVEGPSLLSCIHRDAFTHKEYALIIVKVGRALQHAHRKDVIHSDIVPSNILLKSDGAPKLTDFGIARFYGKAPAGLKPGVTAGTPVYMSPEQAAGMTEVVDWRTDVYSLAAVLYECVTGRAPFSGKSTEEILRKVIRADPPKPRLVEPLVDPGLEKILLRAMDKDPKHRYANMKHFADAVQEWAGKASDWVSMVP